MFEPIMRTEAALLSELLSASFAFERRKDLQVIATAAQFQVTLVVGERTETTAARRARVRHFAGVFPLVDSAGSGMGVLLGTISTLKGNQ